MTLSPTPRSTLRRHPERGGQDRRALHDVLDAALVCHLGVVVDGAPRVLPTFHGRDGDVLFLHGSTGAASLRAALESPVCVTVTLFDGVVYARSVFHHSANYRSAMVFGRPRAVTDEQAKRHALGVIVDHLAPGSWQHARGPSRKELAATSVLALDLAEASVKIRTGPPVDDQSDVDGGGGWAGVLPLHAVWGEPQPCPLLPAGVAAPPHVQARNSTGRPDRSTSELYGAAPCAANGRRMS